MSSPIPEESKSGSEMFPSPPPTPDIIFTSPKPHDASITQGPPPTPSGPIFEKPPSYKTKVKGPTRVGSVVRIVTPPHRSLNRSASYRHSQSLLQVIPRSSSATPRLMNSSTPRSVRDLRSKNPSQKDLIAMARQRRSRKRRSNAGSVSGSLSYSSIRSPYAASLNFSNYNSPFGFRSPHSPKSRSRSASGYSTPAVEPRSPGILSGTQTPIVTEFPGRNARDGSFDLNATLMNMSITSRDHHPGRSVSRLSRDTSVLGQSRVSLNLSGNISIELQPPKIDAPTQLEATHPAKENLRRARLMSRLIIGLAQGSYSKLEQYFHKFDVDSPYGKKVVTQRTPNVFDVRLFLKNPMPSGYFEMAPTFQRNAPEGYVLYRMAKSLTVEDKSLMKDMWGPCLQDDEFLTPAVLHPWIAKGVKKAVKELQGIKIGRSTYGFLVSYKPPEVVVIVRAISEATLVSSVFTLHIIPAILETGRPKLPGFHLRMPLPPVLPYSRSGMNVMRQVENELEDGKLVWFLEGRHIEQPASKSGSARKKWKDRHSGCLDHAHQCKHNPRSDTRTWVISLASLETRLLELSLKAAPMHVAKKGFNLFEKMFEGAEELWNVMGKQQLTSLKLWTIKRTALRNRDQQDWLKALLRLVLESTDKKFGTYFLQPSVNFLSETEQKPVDALVKHLKDINLAGSASTSSQKSLPKSCPQRTQLVSPSKTPKSKPHNPSAYNWG